MCILKQNTSAISQEQAWTNNSPQSIGPIESMPPLYFHIALWKVKKTCTRHPLQNFVSYVEMCLIEVSTHQAPRGSIPGRVG